MRTPVGLQYIYLVTTPLVRPAIAAAIEIAVAATPATAAAVATATATPVSAAATATPTTAVATTTAPMSTAAREGRRWLAVVGAVAWRRVGSALHPVPLHRFCDGMPEQREQSPSQEARIGRPIGSQAPLSMRQTMYGHEEGHITRYMC